MNVDDITNRRYKLFTYVKGNAWKKAFNYIIKNKMTLPEFTLPETLGGKNILQFACDIVEEDDASKTVQDIFLHLQTYSYTRKELQEFVNYTDFSQPPALSIALTRQYDKVVGLLILNFADISTEDIPPHLRTRLGYRYHEIIQRMFDAGIVIEKNVHSPDIELLWTLECDFSQISGAKSVRSREPEDYLETQNLTALITQEQYKRQEILLHPLVQIFLHLKGQHFVWPMCISTFYHVLWLVTNIIFIFDHTGWLNVDDIHDGNSGSCSTDEISCILRPTDFLCSSSYLRNTDTILLEFNFWSVITAGFYITTFIWELYKLITFIKLDYTYCQLGEWMLLVLLPSTNFIPVILYFYDVNWVWAYHVYKFGNFVCLILSVLLIQIWISKSQYVGMYNEMLLKTFGRFSWAFLAFSPMLAAFMISFRLLLPLRQQFNLNWAISFPKVLSMMVGELTYDELFHDDNTSVLYTIASRLVYLLFVVFVVILLQNLLVGLAVEDIKEHSREYLANHLTTKLQTINTTERFFFCRPFLKCLKALDLENLFLVTKLPSENKQEFRYNLRSRINMIDLPWELQQEIIKKDSTDMRRTRQKYADSIHLAKIQRRSRSYPI